MATETASFGAGKRENHDASAYYRRRMSARPAPSVPDTAPEAASPPPEVVDRLFCATSEDMARIPDGCVALMVTSPPYNVGKEYDEEMTLEEYRRFLSTV